MTLGWDKGVTLGQTSLSCDRVFSIQQEMQDCGQMGLGWAMSVDDKLPGLKVSGMFWTDIADLETPIPMRGLPELMDRAERPHIKPGVRAG